MDSNEGKPSNEERRKEENDGPDSSKRAEAPLGVSCIFEEGNFCNDASQYVVISQSVNNSNNVGY